MTVKVLWSLENSEIGTDTAPVKLQLSSSEDKFYSDPELNEMLIVDKILETADETEMEIIKGLLTNKNVEEIAEDCFLSVSGVKYRIKKLVESGNAESKSQAVSLLKKYIRI